MFGLIQKTIVAGIGAATMTKEKAEGLVDELIKRGEVASENRPKIVQDLLARAGERERVLEEKINKAVGKTIGKLGLSSKSDLNALNEKIERLAKKVEEMKKTTMK